MPITTISLAENDTELLKKEWLRIEKLYSKSIANLDPLSDQLLNHAHKIFFEKEKRDVFYRASRILLNEAFNGNRKMPEADILEILLQTWNKQYYRFHPWTNQHHSELDKLINKYEKQFNTIRDKNISSCREGLHGDEGWIWVLFTEFKNVLGPVGAAKALHLISPAYFPLWDGKIAKEAYHVPLNQTRYLAMIRVVKHQIEHLSQPDDKETTILKLLDEYNYCHYTQSWI